MKTTIKSICAAFAAVFAVSVFADVPTSITKFVPDKMNYQGYLADPSSGNAYTDGIYDLECRLYRAQSGGTAIWGAKYSVYVKDGYFNIMLGDTAGIDLGYTYSMGNLWRALWYDSSVSEKNNLWLGVTPLQNRNHAPLPSPTEIAPRQQLLAAPYAFRAHSAQYANSSQGNFTVNGNLTVSGSVSLPSSWTMRHIKDTSSELFLGGSNGVFSPSSSSNPDVKMYANNAYFFTVSSMSFTPNNGDVTYTLPANKTFNVKNGTFKVANSTTSISSSGNINVDGASNIKVNNSTSGANLELKNTGATTLKGSAVTVTGTTSVKIQNAKSSDYVELSDTGAAYVNARDVGITSTESGVTINGKSNIILDSADKATAAYSIGGNGKLWWKAGNSHQAYQPAISIVKKNVTINAGNRTGNLQFDTTNSDRVYTVAGFSAPTSLTVGLTACYAFKQNNNWYVHAEIPVAQSSATTITVHLTAYCVDFVTDNR